MSSLWERPAHRDFQVMVKPHGPICNLDCAYCYYLEKEKLYPGSSFRMNDRVLEAAIRQHLRAQRSGHVHFHWQGGEPLLMGLDFYQRAVELQERYRAPVQRVHNHLQTNGLLLDEAWCRFLHTHDFVVGVSLDGPQPMHDAYRVDRGGQPSFEKVLRGIEHLKAAGLLPNILVSVHSANGDHPLEVYRYLRDQVGARHLQFIPIVEGAEGNGPNGQPALTNPSVTGPQYGKFLIEIFEEWLREDVGEVFVQLFEITLGKWLDGRPGICVFEGTCGTVPALEHNGDLYTCDHFVEPEHRLGNLLEIGLEPLTRSEQAIRFGQAKRDRLPQTCLDCSVRALCNGGCPKNRFFTTQDGEPGLNALCQGYLAFFTHTSQPLQQMAEALRRGLEPAPIRSRISP